MKRHAKSLNRLTFIVSLISMAFLVSCSSSNQLASSFGKRKYMPGHFFDAVAKVKTKFVPVSITETIPTRKAESITPPITSASVLTVVSARTASSINPNRTVSIAGRHLIETTTISSKNATQNSLIKTESGPENITTYHHGGGGDSGSGLHAFYGRLLLYCIILALVWFLLAASGIAGGGTATIMLAFGVIFIVVALIYLFLWLATAGS